MPSVEEVTSLRAKLWDAGFRPIPIYGPQANVPSPGKQPLGKKWEVEARKDPPFCANNPAVSHALNTGLLCDDLRPIDLDVDDAEKARQLRALAYDMLGEAPIRERAGSPRCLLLYRAANGQPTKRTITGRSHTTEQAYKIEVLGKGQQFVAFGKHHSGSDLTWFPDPPGHELRDGLIPVTEDQIQAFLEAAAVIIDAPEPLLPNGKDHHASSEAQAEFLRVAAALASIPNGAPPNWESWNPIGMALWRATDGSEAGRQAWHDWSARNSSYDHDKTEERWQHYRTSPPTQIGAGSIFFLSRAAANSSQRREAPGPAGDTPGTCLDGPPTIPFSTFSDVQDAEDVNDFIENLLVMGAMSVIYGQSNCGKSFFALALAMCVAAGVPWREQAVERGAVLYLALEGGKQAISNRLVAIKQHEGWGGYDLPFAFISVSVNLRNPDADVQPLIDTVAAVAQRFAEAECPVRLIVVDTLSRAMAGGNENSSEDMGALVINCDRIRERTRAHLALLHHSGKDEAKGARGHSNLQGATDTEIEIIDRDGTRTVTVTKQRDLPTLEPFAFTLKCVEIGTNRRGKAITTCLVEYEGTPTKRSDKSGQKQPTHAQRALEILLDLCAADGIKGFAGVPSDFATVPADWWRDRFYQRALPGEDADTKKHAFARASKALIGQHKVGMVNNRVWITYPENQP